MSSAAPYHHGDLPAALVTAALEILDEDGQSDLSLRAVARRAGVSAAAPYRHFADRNELASAVAAIGYTRLARQLVAAAPEPATTDDLAALASAYIRFALDHAGLFRIMFTEGCDPESPDRVDAVAAIHSYLHDVVTRTLPGRPAEATATALWATVHGLAFLLLDGKIDPAAADDTARSTIHALLGRP